MRDEDWHPNQGPRSWIYYAPFVGHRWVRDIAVINVVSPTDWHLFINHIHVATFDSWAEARDATPMMINLHGYESQS